jgi:flagellar motor switch protein FliM
MAEEIPKTTTGSLDQSEIDRLQAQTDAQRATAPPAAPLVILRADGRRTAGDAGRKFDAYDFRNPVFLSEMELSRLRLQHEDFVRYLSARLSLFLRMELSLKLAQLTTDTYTKFTESLPDLSHLCLFKVEPLVGVGILGLNSRLALTIADRMLGGRGHSVKTERGLSEIEIALLEDIVQMILEEWCGQWQSGEKLRGLLIGHENNGRFLQTSPKNAIVLALSIEATFGDCTAQIQIGVPYYTIEPLLKKPSARYEKGASSAPLEKQPAWHPAYDGVTVPVRAEWRAFELSFREVFNLRSGDVLEMPAAHLQETLVLLNGVPKFVGTVGLDTDRVAVKLTRKLPPEDTNHA